MGRPVLLPTPPFSVGRELAFAPLHYPLKAVCGIDPDDLLARAPAFVAVHGIAAHLEAWRWKVPWRWMCGQVPRLTKEDIRRIVGSLHLD